MSNGGAGRPPGGADGGPYADDDLGADGRYVDPAGYNWSELSGRHRGDRYGQGGQFGDRGGYGGAGYGEPSYGQDPYGSGHGQGWPAGGGYGYPGDQPARESYDQDPGRGWYGKGFDSSGRSGYDRDGYGHGDYGRGPYGHGHYDRDGQGGYGGDHYTGAPYRDDGYSGGGYRQDGPSTDSYGRDRYAQEGYGSPGGYRSPDSPDGGSFDSRDSSWFGRPDTGSFGLPDEYPHGGQQSRYGLPAGTVRRAELTSSTTGRLDDEDSPLGLGASSEHGGYDRWADGSDDADAWPGNEPGGHEDDWQDESDDSGLLSRRFSDGGDSRRGTARRAGRVRRQRRLRGKFATIAAILAGALVLGAVADYGYERVAAWHKTRYGDYTGLGSGQVRFTVPAGAALSALGPQLMQAGVIMEVRPYDSAAAAAPNGSHLQPGIYLLHKHMSSALAVQWLLSSAHRSSNQITLIEGLRAVRIAQLLAKQSGLPVSQFTQIIDHPPASLGLPSWAAGKTAEGFLFPDTYTLAPKMTALQILQMMVTEFKRQVAAVNLVGEAHNVFTTPWHALIVGSMIQAEAGSVSDFGKISRVVWNRLKTGMKLQFDSTIFYAMGTYGTYAKTLQQRNFNSPYNTYLHAGLPPGPIGNPGIAAIQAAIHASHGPWLYFIADTNVKPPVTKFTASYSQFQTWQQEFQG
jgi:UPF0755 protein